MEEAQIEIPVASSQESSLFLSLTIQGGLNSYLLLHRFNSMDALLSLIGSGAKVNVANSLTGSTALHEAAAFGNKEIVEHLLKNANADANASDFKVVTPLMHASGAGYSIICQLLLLYGATIDICSAEGMTVLHFAATNGDSYVTQQIVGAGKQALPTFLFESSSTGCFSCPSHFRSIV